MNTAAIIQFPSSVSQPKNIEEWTNDEQFDTAIASGAIPPGMTRVDASVGAVRVTLRTDEEWASYINAPEANPVMAIIERGKRLKERRDACDQKGDRSNTFEAFCKQWLRMSRVTAYAYIRVAGKDRVVKHALRLPPSLFTLDVIDDLTDEQFDAAISSGAIHPEMTRADAEALREKAKPAKTVTPVEEPDSDGPVRDEEPVSQPTRKADDEDNDTPPFDTGEGVEPDPAVEPEWKKPENPVKVVRKAEGIAANAVVTSEDVATSINLLIYSLEWMDKEFDAEVLHKYRKTMNWSNLDKLIDILNKLKSYKE